MARKEVEAFMQRMNEQKQAEVQMFKPNADMAGQVPMPVQKGLPSETVQVAGVPVQAEQAEVENNGNGGRMEGEYTPSVSARYSAGKTDVGKSLFASKIEAGLSKYGLKSLDEFNQLRLKDVSLLSQNEKSKLKAIRESEPAPDSKTMMQKVIPASVINKYLDGTYNQIGGYITKAEDVAHLRSFNDIYHSMRLDYPDTAFDLDKDNSLGVIRFRTAEASKIRIPYSQEMGGTTLEKQPFTGNGFTKAENGQTIPEYKVTDYANMEDGAELYEISKNGEEILKAIYSARLGRFVSVN